MRFIIVTAFLFTVLNFAQQKDSSPIPQECSQLIIMVTKSAEAVSGILEVFERTDEKNQWKSVGTDIQVVLGRSGLAWGRGLFSVDTTKLPVKKEGDGKSPAGVFTLSAVFGYADISQKPNLKMPYIHVTELLECIDDPSSKYYNSLKLRNDADSVDWNSSERMFYADIYYEQGILVDHNANPPVPGAGSCIFIHNWSRPGETSSGCTEMDPVELKKIISWLDINKKPVLVQLTESLYLEYMHSWKLPIVNTR